jgi:Xaa-Pro dipeptidase
MALHFSRDEFKRRQAAACREMARQGLDGLLIFRQESMYYLTGYDTGGYSMFQGMYLAQNGRIALLTRTADRIQSRLTSVLKDIRIWYDRDGANPAMDLRDMMQDLGAKGGRVGIEYHAYGFTAQRGRMVDAALEGFCRTEDATDLVRLLRLVKSPAELKYVRRAGQLSDEALAVANAMCVPGEHIGAIYGEMMNVIMRGDGDPTASRWPMGAGKDALMVRYHTGHGKVGKQDNAVFEFAASYRHYHAALMHNVITGKPTQRQKDMYAACREALAACEDTLRAGKTVGDIYAAHAKSMTKSGFKKQMLAACGYTLGATYPPSWMDWPMMWANNPQVIEAGMVFFMHMILLDDRTGVSMSLGETAIVTKGKCEPVNHAPRRLVVN